MVVALREFDNRCLTQLAAPSLPHALLLVQRQLFPQDIPLLCIASTCTCVYIIAEPTGYMLAICYYMYLQGGVHVPCDPVKQQHYMYNVHLGKHHLQGKRRTSVSKAVR